MFSCNNTVLFVVKCIKCVIINPGEINENVMWYLAYLLAFVELSSQTWRWHWPLVTLKTAHIYKSQNKQQHTAVNGSNSLASTLSFHSCFGLPCYSTFTVSLDYWFGSPCQLYPSTRHWTNRFNSILLYPSNRHWAHRIGLLYPFTGGLVNHSNLRLLHPFTCSLTNSSNSKLLYPSTRW